VEALLARCSQTEEPGIVTFRTTAQQTITFDVNMRCAGRYGCVLGAAASDGRGRFVQQLLDLGAEVNPSQKDVYSPLIHSLGHRSDEATELLLRYGANVNEVYKNNILGAPLTYAAANNYYRSARVLLALVRTSIIEVSTERLWIMLCLGDSPRLFGSYGKPTTLKWGGFTTITTHLSIMLCTIGVEWATNTGIEHPTTAIVRPRQSIALNFGLIYHVHTKASKT
jgi:hypothetical protein